MIMSTKLNCHICNGNLSKFENFDRFHHVSSDCKPVEGLSKLALCLNCSVVQKIISKDWIHQTNQIYSNYSVYSQSSGDEQVTFSSNDGAAQKRSNLYIDWISSVINTKIDGTLLDVGCGNGSFIKEFGNHHHSWKKIGYELNDINKKTIEKIPNTLFFSGDINKINEKINLVTLIHCFEHLINPLNFLEKIKSLVGAEAYVFLQLPNLKTSPFDILISDHCSHFTKDTLTNIISFAGFDIVDVSESVVPKELSLIMKPSLEKSQESANNTLYKKNHSLVIEHIKFLNKFVSRIKKYHGPVGIFGSSISATWLFSEINGEIDFFVDEDTSRINRSHLSIPIIDVKSIPKNSTLYFPLQSSIVEELVKRIKFDASINLVTP